MTTLTKIKVQNEKKETGEKTLQKHKKYKRQEISMSKN